MAKQIKVLALVIGLGCALFYLKIAIQWSLCIIIGAAGLFLLAGPLLKCANPLACISGALCGGSKAEKPEAPTIIYQVPQSSSTKEAPATPYVYPLPQGQPMAPQQPAIPYAPSALPYNGQPQAAYPMGAQQWPQAYNPGYPQSAPIFATVNPQLPQMYPVQMPVASMQGFAIPLSAPTSATYSTATQDQPRYQEAPQQPLSQPIIPLPQQAPMSFTRPEAPQQMYYSYPVQPIIQTAPSSTPLTTSSRPQHQGMSRSSKKTIDRSMRFDARKTP